MQSNFPKNTAAEAPWLVIHPLSRGDSIAVAALRSVVAPMKGKVEGTAAAVRSTTSWREWRSPRVWPLKPIRSEG